MRINSSLILLFICLQSSSLAFAETNWLKRQRSLYDQPLSQGDTGLKWIRKSEGRGALVTAREQSPKKQISLQKSLSIRDLDVSIDWTKLRYDGCHDIRKDKDFGAKGASTLQLKSSYHRYSYGANILVFAKRLDIRDQLLIHACLRGLQILKLRYPAVYNDLYKPRGTLSSKQIQTQYKRDIERSKSAKVPWVNINSKVVFIINNSGTESAQSLYLLGPSKKVKLGKIGAVPVYHNSLVITLNVAHLSHRGSQSVYTGMSQRDAFLYYIRDGIVETLVHEGFHCLISRDRHINEQFNVIRGFQSSRGGFGKRGKSIEEAIVCNSSLRFFESEAVKETGLHKQVFDFYRKAMFEKIHIPRVQAMNKESRGQVFKTLQIKVGKTLKETLILKRLYLEK
ncbi:MAG: hypothetical protein P1V97_08930 [Planctomycetota bacterium]|nr:hypothetical protein [Planctomycetota bacterium]